MPALSPSLFDAAVDLLQPFMATVANRQEELLPFLNNKPVNGHIDWEGDPHTFTVRLVNILSYDELIEAIKRLRPKVGEEQYKHIQSICTRVRRAKARPPATGSTNGKPKRANLAPIKKYLKAIPRLVAGALPHGFISPKVVDLDAPEDPPQDAVECIWELIRREKRTFVLVLGNYGAGKTSLCFGAGLQIAEAALKDFPKQPIPIYFHLGYTRSKTAPRLIEAIPDLLKDYDIETTVADLETMIKQYRTVLLLDGLDEMVNRVHVEDLHAALEKIHDLVLLSKHMDVVLTCRETFFQSPSEIGAITGVTDRLRLLPFDTDQVHQYLGGWQPSGETRAKARIKAKLMELAKDTLAKDPKLEEITRTPVHLFLFGRYLERIIRSKQPVDGIDLLKLYDSFIDEALTRDMKAVVGDSNAIAQWPLQHRVWLLHELAYNWYKHDVSDWTSREFEQFVEEHLNKIERDLDPDRKLQIVGLRARFITTCSFFLRIAVSNRFRFTHKSFREYLVADAIVTDLRNGSLEKWDTPLYSEIYDFAIRLIRRAELSENTLRLVFKSGSLVAQGNFLAVLSRWVDPKIGAILRTQAVKNLYPVDRLVAIQSLGAYEPSPSNIDCLLQVLEKEPNSIPREMARTISRKYAQRAQADGYRNADLLAVAATSGSLIPAEARALLDSNGEDHSGIRYTYRKALHFGDMGWHAVVGAIYILGAGGDSTSRDDLIQVAGASRDAEIRRAYAEVRKLNTFDPPLPELPPLAVAASAAKPASSD